VAAVVVAAAATTGKRREERGGWSWEKKKWSETSSGAGFKLLPSFLFPADPPSEFGGTDGCFFASPTLQLLSPSLFSLSLLWLSSSSSSSE
jgi:hypothetical protein